MKCELIKRLLVPYIIYFFDEESTFSVKFCKILRPLYDYKTMTTWIFTNVLASASRPTNTGSVKQSGKYPLRETSLNLIVSFRPILAIRPKYNWFPGRGDPLSPLRYIFFKGWHENLRQSIGNVIRKICRSNLFPMEKINRGIPKLKIT